jgi:hypothetical protein
MVPAGALNIDAAETIVIAANPTVNLHDTVLSPLGKENWKPDNSRLSCRNKARLNAFGTLAWTHRYYFLPLHYAIAYCPEVTHRNASIMVHEAAPRYARALAQCCGGRPRRCQHQPS